MPYVWSCLVNMSFTNRINLSWVVQGAIKAARTYLFTYPSTMSAVMLYWIFQYHDWWSIFCQVSCQWVADWMWIGCGLEGLVMIDAGCNLPNAIQISSAFPSTWQSWSDARRKGIFAGWCVGETTNMGVNTCIWVKYKVTFVTGNSNFTVFLSEREQDNPLLVLRP